MYKSIISADQKKFVRSIQGFTIFLTGLSGSGKTTTAQELFARLSKIDRRPVTVLDGDLVRQQISTDLGFSRKDREINVKRVGLMASEITKNGGIAICALIAPYEKSRRENRELISQYGGYIEVYVSTPLEVCEQRDPKGLYAKARQGLIKNFTGIDDPYEVPEKPEIIVDTSKMTPGEAGEKIMQYLQKEGYIR